MALAVYLKNYTSELTNEVNVQFKKLYETDLKKDPQALQGIVN